MDLVEHACATGTFAELSTTERTILTYLVNHEDEVINSTLSAIARETFSSTTSVIRLSKKLGFAGFSELKFFIKNSRQGHSFNSQDLLEGVRADTMNSIDTLLNSPEFSTPINIIHKARVIYLCATGYSQRLAAKELMKALLNYGYFCVLIPSHLELENGLGAIQKEDVVMILSLSGATPGYENILTKLKARGVKIICLAAHTNGYIAEASDHLLTYQSTPIPVSPRSKDFVSLIGLHILVDFIIRKLLIQKMENNENSY
ncbi:SIS domain-containing protein [Corynebacterium sp. 3HC-13]|nr:MurR/RpiR family transcriptional regulator [Corynebacterium poyangense]MBZ8176621.1 SIS domain-containing protein [Corynebacterium poyangense]